MNVGLCNQKPRTMTSLHIKSRNTCDSSGPHYQQVAFADCKYTITPSVLLGYRGQHKAIPANANGYVQNFELENRPGLSTG